jgi:hypothetical protein
MHPSVAVLSFLPNMRKAILSIPGMAIGHLPVLTLLLVGLCNGLQAEHSSAAQHALRELLFPKHKTIPTISDYQDMAKQPLRNIALTNLWEMQFYGDVYIGWSDRMRFMSSYSSTRTQHNAELLTYVGTPPQKMTVVFDTGSGRCYSIYIRAPCSILICCVCVSRSRVCVCLHVLTYACV